jgi:transposase
MWKSAISNHGSQDKFLIKDLSKSRSRKNLVIEPASLSKNINAIFKTQLGEMQTNLPLNLIKKNSILQYNKKSKQYIIIVPQDNIEKFNLIRSKKCGIDIGARTFLTTYSNNESYEIGTHNTTYVIMKKYFNKLDNLQSSHDNNIINTKTYNLARSKYYDKIRNKIDDMHNKSASFLVQHYEEIIIGKVSTKKMVSNLKNDIYKITKRRLLTLSHYRFRMKLIMMAKKYKS